MIVTHLANAGILVEGKSGKVMVDGLCCPNDIYLHTPEQEREKICFGRGPYEGISLMVFTHEHSDHFEPEGLACFLKNNRQALGIVNRAAKEKALPLLSGQEQRVLAPAAGNMGSICLSSGDVKVSLYPTKHDGGEAFAQVENLAVLIEMDGKKVLHLGDCALVKENYKDRGFREASIDLLVADFPSLGLDRGLRLIREFIAPRQIMAVHFPGKNADQWNWTASTLKHYERAGRPFGDVLFARESGEQIVI